MDRARLCKFLQGFATCIVCSHLVCGRHRYVATHRLMGYCTISRHDLHSVFFFLQAHRGHNTLVVIRLGMVDLVPEPPECQTLKECPGMARAAIHSARARQGPADMAAPDQSCTHRILEDCNLISSTPIARNSLMKTRVQNS